MQNLHLLPAPAKRKTLLKAGLVISGRVKPGRAKTSLGIAGLWIAALAIAGIAYPAGAQFGSQSNSGGSSSPSIQVAAPATQSAPTPSSFQGSVVSGTATADTLSLTL